MNTLNTYIKKTISEQNRDFVFIPDRDTRALYAAKEKAAIGAMETCVRSIMNSLQKQEIHAGIEEQETGNEPNKEIHKYTVRQVNSIQGNNRNECRLLVEYIKEEIDICVRTIMKYENCLDIAEKWNDCKKTLFEILSKTVIIPFLSEYFKQQSTELSDIDYFTSFASLAGYYRNFIARLSIEKNADNFGVLQPKGSYYKLIRLIDKVSQNSEWKLWEKELENRVKKIIENPQEYPLISASFSLLAIREMNNEPLFTATPKSYLYYGYDYYDREKGIQGVECKHRHSTDEEDMEMGKRMKQFLAKETLDVLTIKKDLAAILWFMCSGTFFVRGQAGIAGWLVKALALIKGFELSFAEEWTAPGDINYDQRALLCVIEDDFLTEENLEYLLLKPLG